MHGATRQPTFIALRRPSRVCKRVSRMLSHSIVSQRSTREERRRLACMRRRRCPHLRKPSRVTTNGISANRLPQTLQGESGLMAMDPVIVHLDSE